MNLSVLSKIRNWEMNALSVFWLPWILLWEATSPFLHLISVTLLILWSCLLCHKDIYETQAVYMHIYEAYLCAIPSYWIYNDCTRGWLSNSSRTRIRFLMGSAKDVLCLKWQRVVSQCETNCWERGSTGKKEKDDGKKSMRVCICENMYTVMCVHVHINMYKTLVRANTWSSYFF